MPTRNSFSTSALPKSLAIVAAVTLSIAILNWLSLELAQHVTQCPVFWPGLGIALAALLLYPHRRIHILSGVYVGSVIADCFVRGRFTSILAGPLICSTGLLFADILARRAIGTPFEFRRWWPLLKFLFAAMIAASATGLAAGIFYSVTTHSNLWKLWFDWSVTGSLSYAIFAPLLVILADWRSPERPPVKLRRIVVACVINAVVAVIALGQSVAPILFVVPCALIVTSMAGGIEAMVLGLLIDSLIFIAFAIWGAALVHFLPGTASFRLMAAQFYLALISFALLPVAAAIAERERLRWDLTRSLARLKESEAEFRLMAETAQDIIVRSDLSGRVEYVSPAVQTITGYAPAEIVGRKVMPNWDAEVSAAVWKTTSEALKASAGKTVCYRFCRKDGRDVWLESRPTYLRDDRGQPIAIFNIARDITDRKAMEAELIVARDRAEAAASAKAEFLSNMSHELRTPLTSVLGFAELLSEHSGIDRKGKEFVDRIRSAGQALLSTVNDVLDFSKLESGQFELASNVIEIAQHAAQALDVLRVQAQAKHLELAFRCSSELGGTRCLADQHRLRQVILNLVGNAIKFTDKGCVVLTLASAVRDGRPYLRYEVSDTGAGIAPDQLAKLFQRFSQVDGSSTRQHGGTGLGLAICKAIVEAMEGKIGVTSTLGQGSVFWFEIPLREDAVPGAIRAGAKTSANRTRLLIVDDNPANRTLVQAALSRVDVEADEARSGKEALALSERHSYDLILMDVQMPEMDGVAAMRAIRAGRGASAAAPIWAFTAEGDNARLAALRTAGFDGIIAKPLDILQLQKTVTAALAAADRQQQRDVA